MELIVLFDMTCDCCIETVLQLPDCRWQPHLFALKAKITFEDPSKLLYLYVISAQFCRYVGSRIHFFVALFSIAVDAISIPSQHEYGYFVIPGGSTHWLARRLISHLETRKHHLHGRFVLKFSLPRRCPQVDNMLVCAGCHRIDSPMYIRLTVSRVSFG